MTNLAPNPLPREMFVRILKNLYNLAGSKQYLDIAGTHNTEEVANQKLNELLQPMINVSNTFSYIPLSDQEQIIEQRILEDPEFYGLNARKIWQYLNSVSGKYFVQEAHKKTEKESRQSNARELTQEEFNTKLEEWMNRLKDVQESFKTPKLTQDQIEAEGQEKLTPRATAGHVASESPEIVEKRLAAIKKLGYDKLTPKEVSEMQIFKVGTHDIRARNQEEAEQIALEVYA